MSRHPTNSQTETTSKSPPYRCTTNKNCPNPHCFICIINEVTPSLRRARISIFLKNLPLVESPDQVMILSYLWNLAMTHPDDPELPSLGIFDCMARLIIKAVNDMEWLVSNQNIYIPYYAAHIIGSYTMSKPEFACQAVTAGGGGGGGVVIPALMELMRGKLTWVEQRVAVRALGHLASYKETFGAVKEYEDEIVRLGKDLALNCVELVYRVYVGVEDRGKRLSYHSDLLTRGVGGLEIENRKAEEWVSQLQCWSLNLLNCFATSGGRGLRLICEDLGFLKQVCGLWGGIVNEVSPAGVGLIRILCYREVGRRAVAGVSEIVGSLVRLCRSCDDWQYIGIDCLVLLLRDPSTRWDVMENSGVVSCLADLIELRRLGGRSRIGEIIISALIVDSDDDHILPQMKSCKKSQFALEEVLEFVERRRLEKLTMTKEKVEEMKVLSELMKREGNRSFKAGEIEQALKKYSEALEVCPVRLRKERMVLYGNRAQCCLLLRDWDGVIRDATRALCLAKPTNSNSKCLWRRCQAYDAKGFGRESLMDCVMFVNYCAYKGRKRGRELNNVDVRIPKFVACMISKQMEAAWLFAAAKLKVDSCSMRRFRVHDDDYVSPQSNGNADGRGAVGVDRSCKRD